jgi:polysaccharide deacetylase family sporulation protein PdaB
MSAMKRAGLLLYLGVLLFILTLSFSLTSFAADDRDRDSVVDVNRDASKPTKKIALTFDDGPNREATPRILKILEKYDVKATFFVVGWRVYNFRDLILNMVQNGHEIGNHSYDHPYLNKLKDDEIKKQLQMTNTAIEKVAGIKVTLYRPPYASYDDRVLSIGSDLSMELALWTINPEDWRSPGKEIIISRILRDAQDGSIVLLHDKTQTAEALPTLIESLKEQGFELVTVSELLKTP